VVPDDIIVSLLCVELDREASNIADSVGAALFSASGTQSEKDLSLLANGIKELGASQLGDFRVGDFEFSPGTSGLCMNNSAGMC
jgi:hypothetical protein